MKNYLYLTLIALFTLGSTMTVNGQSKKEEHKTSMSSGTVSIVDIDELIIEAYSGSEVIVSAMVEETEENDRAKGLRMLNSLGLDDNTGFGISVKKEGNTLNIVQVSKSCNCSKVTIQVPQGVNISVAHGNYNAETLIVRNVSSELEITTNHHNIRLEDVTGPMAVKTVYGSIDAKFSSLSQKGSVSLYSVYELVDVSIPSTAKSNIMLSALHGDVYSNADINVESKETKQTHGSCGTGTVIAGTLNGGGVSLNIKSSYEDVYLRTGN